MLFNYKNTLLIIINVFHLEIILIKKSHPFRDYFYDSYILMTCLIDAKLLQLLK